MKWTIEDISFLKSNYNTNMELEEIAKKLNKTRRAVIHKAAREGLSRLNVPINKPKNRDHRRIYDLNYYNRNSKTINKRKREREKKYKVEIVNLLGGKCKMCGYDKCIDAFDFHHIGSNKEASISRLLKGYSKEKILKEANKCILLCANCHREAHYKGP